MAGDPLLTSSYDTSITDVTHLGANRTLNIYDKKVKQDISDYITQIDPNKAPFLRFLEAISNKEVTSNFKFEWMEEDNKDLHTTVAAGSAMIGSAVSTDLQTAASNLYQRDDILLITHLADNSTEMVRVVSKTSATQYVVFRSASGTTATANTVAADEVLKIGHNAAENAQTADPDSTSPVWYYNFCQTFKHTVGISGRFDAMDMRGTSSEINKQLKSRMRDHVESIEAAFLFGQRDHDNTNEGTRTYTGGLQWLVDTYAATDNYYDATGETFNEKWLDSMSNSFFRYGSDRKVAIVGGQIISKLGTFAKEYLRYNDKASVKLGMECMDYMSSHGTISFLHSRLLDDSSVYQKHMFLFDPSFIRKRFLKGRDTQLNMNVQENDRDGRVHEILSDVGLEVRLPNAHFVITGLDNSITP
jgi:hypothetical protein